MAPSVRTLEACWTGGDGHPYRLSTTGRSADVTERCLLRYQWVTIARQSTLATQCPRWADRPSSGWAVNRWVDGRIATDDEGDSRTFATDLGGFVAALRQADTAGARAGYRSGPLRDRDAYVRGWTAAAAS